MFTSEQNCPKKQEIGPKLTGQLRYDMTRLLPMQQNSLEISLLN